jgi:tRNA(Met) C34 N-acetyltransferase TmcA
MNKNIPIHGQFSTLILQEALFTILSNIKVPTVWTTQRQVGKSTILTKIAAHAVLNQEIGDIWIVTHNAASDMHFLEKIERQLPENERVRKNRSRLEVLSTTNRILTARSLPPVQNGLNLEPPKLIIFDEIAFINTDLIEKIANCIRKENLPYIRIIGATTSGGSTDYPQLFKKHFGGYEEVWTGNLSTNKYFEQMHLFGD